MDILKALFNCKYDKTIGEPREVKKYKTTVTVWYKQELSIREAFTIEDVIRCYSYDGFLEVSIKDKTYHISKDVIETYVYESIEVDD